MLTAKTRIRHTVKVIPFLFLFAVTPYLRAGDLKPEPGYGTIASLFAQEFWQKHLTRKRLDNTISATAWTNYLASLDYDRVYFLQSDIAGFRREQNLLDDKLREGNVDFAYKVFRIYKQRVKNRAEYVSDLMEQGFDLYKEETYQWQRKDADWPEDEKAWNEIWRKKIKNDYVQNKVRQMVAEEKDRDKTGNTEKEENDTSIEIEPMTPEESINKRYHRLSTVLNDYDAEWVLERYLTSFAHSYDPHSGYMSPTSVEDFNIEMKLSLVGIGALLKSEDGTAKIVRIIPGGPADKDKRLQPGDKIIAVSEDNGQPEDIRHLPLYKAVKLIRGEKGTKVVLTIIPASDPTESTTKKIALTRDEVKLEEQAAKSSVEKLKLKDRDFSFGVIKLPNFYADLEASINNEKNYRSSSRDVKKLLLELRDQKVDGILLDLRNNGGGYLPEAVYMSGLFIETGPVVQIRKGWRRNWLGDQDKSVSYTGPLVVLVNRLSASATEIVTGALQDYGRAIIVGDSKTHGKGSVQAIKELGEVDKYGKIKVTTSLFYRISGGSTQLKGIIPDIVLPSPSDYMKIGEDHLPNAIEWSRTHPANYRPLADLSQTIVSLRDKSRKRRNANPDFETYITLLKKIKEMYETGWLPLHIEERRKITETETRIASLQEKLSSWEQDEPNVEKDVVLSESLKILADLTIAQGQNPYPSLSNSHREREKNIADTVAEWLDWLM